MFKTIIVMVINFVMMFTIKAEALQLKLLWEKKLPFAITDLQMAGVSGDIILSSKWSKQIILYDKGGNERFHWGPKVDRQPLEIGISEDGNYIIYVTAWTEEYVWNNNINLQEFGWNHKVHYVTKKGKELWNKEVGGMLYLSPNGQLIAAGAGAGEGPEGDFVLMNSIGNILWNYSNNSGDDNIIFSPDSNYIALSSNPFYKLRLFDKSGNMLWERPYTEGIVSISENANYISICPYNYSEIRHNGMVYDKNGNVVIEGFGVLSGDGKSLLMLYTDKITLMNLPQKATIKEYSIQAALSMIKSPIRETSYLLELSYDGRFVVVVGKKVGDMLNNNLFIIDVQEDKLLEMSAGVINTDGRVGIFLTKDGKYLLVHIYEEHKILYYQVY
ncbi:MAG: hypothetical protein AABY84_09735 [Candidatus Firestonebacteria bacterium]